MKKTIGFVAIALCVLIYYCSNDATLTREYTVFRDKKPYLRFEKYQYGDLFGLSLLPGFKENVSYAPLIQKDSMPKDIDLYIIGDSHLHHNISRDNFTSVNKLFFMRWWYGPTTVKIPAVDSSKRNVLILEMSERFVREIGGKPNLAFNLLQIKPFAKQEIKPKTPPWPVVVSASISDLRLFNPYIAMNLEFNMFDYPLFNYFKEWKAGFNYRVFGRVNKDVTVDPAKNQLYFTPTVADTGNMSSFKPVAETELTHIIQNFNKIYEHYRMLGFDQIYLSVIPNPVTCIHPDLKTYNELIPKLYSVDSLRLSKIDVYNIFKTDPLKYYYRSDTHWNTCGLQVWLDIVNRELKQP